MHSTQPSISRKLVIRILVGLVTLAFALQPLQAQAASASITFNSASASSDCTSATFSATGDWVGGIAGYWYFVGYTYYIDGIPIASSAGGYMQVSGSQPISDSINLPAILAGSQCEVEFFISEVDPSFTTFNKVASLLINIKGSSSAAAPPPDEPPGIWLAHVCEPEDGFSTSEYGDVITIGSDANWKIYGSTLYVGTSIDGPWTATEFAGPNYVLTKPQVEALVELMGLENYHDLWFRASDHGNPANLGSMIEDREAVMDPLCNPG